MSDDTTATTDETTDDTASATDAKATDEKPATGSDSTAEVEKWKALSRKNEAKAKENATKAKEYDDLKASQMSEQEKAVSAAMAEGEAKARKEMGARLAKSEIKAAASGRGIDIDALLEGVDAGKFLGDDGEPDAESIKTWVDKVAPATTDGGTPKVPDLGQGALGSKTDMDEPAVASFAAGLGLTQPKE